MLIPEVFIEQQKLLPSSSPPLLPQSHYPAWHFETSSENCEIMPSNMSSTTLDSFIIGLSHQIPPSKLSTMVSGEDIQRLFLERSTEALPMGSKIRNSVGSNFDKALHLLQLEIEKRMKENERPAASTSNKLQKKKGGKASHKYALMAFSDSCHNFSPTDKRLILCSDYASSTDFLQEKKDVLQSYKHALLYNRYYHHLLIIAHSFLPLLSSFKMMHPMM
jgi:hypothetical protein